MCSTQKINYPQIILDQSSGLHVQDCAVQFILGGRKELHMVGCELFKRYHTIAIGIRSFKQRLEYILVCNCNFMKDQTKTQHRHSSMLLIEWTSVDCEGTWTMDAKHACEFFSYRYSIHQHISWPWLRRDGHPAYIS